ncbi:DUF1223 domain-containing protein [Chitinophaga solisilvae]|uniref:DUF1223 domain-containing protein n=1 Tax=Chitinophaga solisilvae TaxID=1233460 RepID=UPI0013722D42|nr:DUF1223 domain-containing protein [Chitinophaga solisilvae]
MKPFKEIALFIGLPLLFIAMAAFSHINRQQMVSRIQQDSTTRGFAVVELFTSEGCWSCPPADALIEKLQRDNNNRQLYILAFHVDYWDHQGWKDRFSKSAFTDRQKQYAAWLRLSTIYTPQVVINGQTEMVGSDESSVLSGIRSALQETSASGLTIRATVTGKEAVISYTGIAADASAHILVALVQKNASSQVAAGENAGKQLTHVQIVRALEQQPLQAQGQVSAGLPRDFRPGAWEVVAFVQQSATGKITQAAKADL